ncbi:MAG: recombination-associated protein RdgC [Pseudomonadales bacterium]|nr:recombination-associated protein RdgC [Pseudomonadales bacterium]
MLFKNAMIYRLTKTFHLSSDDFREMLEARRFVPCAGYKPSSFGWVSPLGNSREEELPLLHEVSACYLLCARREEKVIPTSALNEAMLEKVAKIEAVEDRTLRAKEKRNIKENTLAELLPGALAKSKQVLGYISPADNLLVIGTASAAEAELFINCIRDSIGTFTVVPPQVKQKPQDIFTNWLLRRKLPENFQLGNQCDLLDIEETSTVSCRRQDLDTQEIRSHLEAGKICTRLGILWHGDLSMSVDKDIVLRQIKIESMTDEDEFQDHDPIAKLDAEFVTMTLEFGRFLPELMSALGGETLPGA